ncbi:MAG: hypothetical protein ACI9XR_001377 [Flavobacterium sp.]|jgi:hypothetical protein
MLRYLNFIIVALMWQSISAQSGFQFPKSKNKVTVSFQLINNLVIIPVKVNGVQLNFLLDTGVEDSVLFSLEATNQVQFENVEQIKIQGFGNSESFYAIKSNNNILSLNGMVDSNHTIFLVLNQEINISTQIGTPVNGILGYHFFKNHFVSTNYQTKKIKFIKKTERTERRLLKQFEMLPIQLYKGKPYIKAQSKTVDSVTSSDYTFLIDSGNSDAIWLMKDSNKNLIIGEPNFNDFLGKGFGGDVYGKRARIQSFQIGRFLFKRPLVSFPDSKSNVVFDSIMNRNGTIGSEILKRFTVVFDYNQERVFLKRNNLFSDPFNYNMSGIEVEHQGLQWISNELRELTLGQNNFFNANGERVFDNVKYKMELKPVYIISNVRENSPAAIAGLQKEDVISKINRKNGFSYKLQDINNLLKSEEGKTITFEIDRKGKILVVSFELKSKI